MENSKIKIKGKKAGVVKGGLAGLIACALFFLIGKLTIDEYFGVGIICFLLCALSAHLIVSQFNRKLKFDESKKALIVGKTEINLNEVKLFSTRNIELKYTIKNPFSQPGNYNVITLATDSVIRSVWCSDEEEFNKVLDFVKSAFTESNVDVQINSNNAAYTYESYLSELPKVQPAKKQNPLEVAKVKINKLPFNNLCKKIPFLSKYANYVFCGIVALLLIFFLFGEDSEISLVKNGTLGYDDSITVETALSTSEKYEIDHWEKWESTKGKTIVSCYLNSLENPEEQVDYEIENLKNTLRDFDKEKFDEAVGEMYAGLDFTYYKLIEAAFWESQKNKNVEISPKLTADDLEELSSKRFEIANRKGYYNGERAFKIIDSALRVDFVITPNSTFKLADMSNESITLKVNDGKEITIESPISAEAILKKFYDLYD